MTARKTTENRVYVMLVMAGLIEGGGLLAFILFIFAGSNKGKI